MLNVHQEERLLENVREISEDYIYDTIEFNEFLQMMAKQQESAHNRTDLKSAFRNGPYQLTDWLIFKYSSFSWPQGKHLMFISVSDGWGDTDVRIFDEDDDGCIHAGDLVDVLTTFGDKISKSEAKKLVQTADKNEGGLIDYEGELSYELSHYWFRHLDLSNTLLPQTQKEKDAEIAEAAEAAVKEQEKIQNAKEENFKTKLCW